MAVLVHFWMTNTSCSLSWNYSSLQSVNCNSTVGNELECSLKCSGITGSPPISIKTILSKHLYKCIMNNDFFFSLFQLVERSMRKRECAIWSTQILIKSTRMLHCLILMLMSTTSLEFDIVMTSYWKNFQIKCLSQLTQRNLNTFVSSEYNNEFNIPR